MRVPSWLDIALEGAALRLQRALVEYRLLRRRIETDWRTDCVAVATRCDRLARSDVEIDAALEKARRRLRQEPRAAAGLPLINAVQREREMLHAAAKRIFTRLDPRPAPEGLATLLSGLAEVVREEAPFELALRRFYKERTSFTVLLCVLIGSAWFYSWWRASLGGVVPTLFAPGELIDSPPVTAAVVCWATLLVGTQVRLGGWAWIGVERQALWTSAAGAAAFAPTCVWWLAQGLPKHEALVAGLLAALSLASALTALGLWMRRPRVPTF